MQPEKSVAGGAVPAIATAAAAAYLAACAFPVPLAGAVVLASVAGCALVLARRPSPALRRALVGIAVWQTLGLAGAFALRARPLGGLAWVLLFLYFAPLPVIPWIYHLTFPREPRTAPPGGNGAAS
ncbi:MAG TPA: hypothetical protein VLW17_00305 [Thermoanaerobaculaceae bacterium]|nr:hypothetical protein [Thermoanaerobaculaceae bacterium]